MARVGDQQGMARASMAVRGALALCAAVTVIPATAGAQAKEPGTPRAEAPAGTTQASDLHDEEARTPWMQG
jgi:hypothetical protein